MEYIRQYELFVLLGLRVKNPGGVSEGLVRAEGLGVALLIDKD